MITSELDPADGCLYLRWTERTDSVSPREAAGAWRDHILQSGAGEAGFMEPSREVAEALVTLPGFLIHHESLEMSLTWPRRIGRPDRTGLQVVTAAEEPRVYAFLKQAGLIAENREDLQRVFGPNGFNIFLVEAGRDVAFGNIIHGNGAGWISYVAVLESERRRGLGRRTTEILLSELEDVPLQRIDLSVSSSKTAAVQLYKSFGFVQSASNGFWMNWTRPKPDSSRITVP